MVVSDRVYGNLFISFHVTHCGAQTQLYAPGPRGSLSCMQSPARFGRQEETDNVVDLLR